MKKQIAFSLIVVLFSVFFLSGCLDLNIPAGNSNQNESKNQICFENNYCINAELAVTNEEKSLGLMNRPYLPENKGMLFVFENERIPSFWMKNMQIPLDIIWIDSNFVVADITENVPPCSYTPCNIYSPKEKVKYVLEVNSGFSKRKRVQIGQRISLSESMLETLS